MRIDFTVPEARALKRYKLKQVKGSTYQTVLVDGLQLLPGFRAILKQEITRYANETKTSSHYRAAKAIEQEFKD